MVCSRCPPCKVIWPDIASFVRVRERDTVWVRVDMSKEPELGSDYNVEQESKIILFKDGIMVREEEEEDHNDKTALWSIDGTARTHG